MKNLRVKSLLPGLVIWAVNEINAIMLLINDSMLHGHQVFRLAPRWEDDWDLGKCTLVRPHRIMTAVVLCLASFFISSFIASFVELHDFLWNIHSFILNLSLRIRHCMRLHSKIERRSFRMTQLSQQRNIRISFTEDGSQMDHAVNSYKLLDGSVGNTNVQVCRHVNSICISSGKWILNYELIGANVAAWESRGSMS